MKNHHPSNIRPRGFTLIEMLVTITIIVILAGLSLGGFKYVSAKQANSQAKIQVELLSKALEEYKLENGDYPPTDDTAKGYDAGPPEKSIDVYVPGAGGVKSTLFKELYQYGVDNKTTIYVSELDPENNKQGWTSSLTGTNINDPWGEPYRYRTAYGPPPPSGPVLKNISTQNPDFDLWSAGADGKDFTPDDIGNF